MKRSTISMIAIMAITTVLLQGCGDNTVPDAAATDTSVTDTSVTDTTDTSATGASVTEDPVPDTTGADEQEAEDTDTSTDTTVDSTEEETIDAGQTNSAASYSVIADPDMTIPLMTLTDLKKMSSDYDADLASMDTDTAYAAIYNILSNPNAFVGTTTRIRGSVLFTTNTDQTSTYANVVLTDSSGKNMQGVEFLRGADGEYSCPDDYPEEGTDVIVTGMFETYYEGEDVFFRIGNCSVELPTS